MQHERVQVRKVGGGGISFAGVIFVKGMRLKITFFCVTLFLR